MLGEEPPELEHITPNSAHAQRLVGEAEGHVVSARAIQDSDPPGAFQLAYDAARKSCEGLLAEQGLRSTQAGGHVAVADAVRAQFNGPGGVRVFGELHGLRRRRAGTQYPQHTTPPITVDDAAALTDEAEEIVQAARTLLDSSGLTPFAS